MLQGYFEILGTLGLFITNIYLRSNVIIFLIEQAYNSQT